PSSQRQSLNRPSPRWSSERPSSEPWHPLDAKRARDGTPRTPEGGKNTERTRVRQTCHTIWADPDAAPCASRARLQAIGVLYPPPWALNPAVSGEFRRNNIMQFFQRPNFLSVLTRAAAVPAQPDQAARRRRRTPCPGWPHRSAASPLRVAVRAPRPARGARPR